MRWPGCRCEEQRCGLSIVCVPMCMSPLAGERPAVRWCVPLPVNTAASGLVSGEHGMGESQYELVGGETHIAPTA